MRAPISTTSLCKAKRPNGNREVGVERWMPAQLRDLAAEDSAVRRRALLARRPG
jgi:hypothetical protein